MPDKTTTQRENAEKFARHVIEKDFGQKVDDKTLNAVVEKILKVIPNKEEALSSN